MELQWIQSCITALKEAGIQAKRGFPSGLTPGLDAPMAAVSIQSAEATKMTMTVQIYAPVSEGGVYCENLALTAAEALRKLGAECKVGTCSYVGKGGLLTLPISAVFVQQVAQYQATAVIPEVKIDDVAVAQVVNVTTGYTSTSAKGKDSSTGLIQMVSGERRWTVTIEDIVEESLSPQIEVEDGFSVTVIRSGEKETYSGCCWDKITTEIVAAGTKRIRVALTCNEPMIEDV